ncbi:MAG: hypothetical protein LBQ09_10715, partial [Acidobacteriaceae bacterium]|jgi:hypothetical protein|nr:hypothetical protein [Acidobacteriaceae bacterium]
MFRDVEKSGAGEVAASLAFAGVAVPVMTASGADPRVAVAAAIPFALFFVTSTLSVRVAIARVRGGGHPAIVAATRRAALLVAAGGAVLLAVAVDRSLLPFSALATSMPGLLTATGIAMRPPPPAKLRVVGWMLVAVSVLTAFGVLVTSAHGRCGEPVTDAEFIRLC